MIVLLLFMLLQIALVGIGIVAEFWIMVRLKKRGLRLLFGVGIPILCAAAVIVEIVRILSRYDGGTVQVSKILFCGVYLCTGALAAGMLKKKYSRPSQKESGKGNRLCAVLAGVIWSAGLFAAFAVGRYTSIVGLFPFSVLMGAVMELVLSSNRAEELLIAAGTAFAFVYLVWITPFFRTWLPRLYAGFHVTESGFAALFTIIGYLAVTLLCLPAFEGLFCIWRRMDKRKTETQ